MKSTRLWLADLIERDIGVIVQGLCALVRADPHLPAAPRDRLGRICMADVRGFVAWLRRGRIRTPHSPQRAGTLARSYFVEWLKRAGVEPDVRRTARALLSAYLREPARLVPGLQKSLDAEPHDPARPGVVRFRT